MNSWSHVAGRWTVAAWSRALWCYKWHAARLLWCSEESSQTAATLQCLQPCSSATFLQSLEGLGATCSYKEIQRVLLRYVKKKAAGAGCVGERVVVLLPAGWCPGAFASLTPPKYAIGDEGHCGCIFWDGRQSCYHQWHSIPVGEKVAHLHLA